MAEVDRSIERSGGKQVSELPSGSPQRRVGHIVDQANDDRFAR
jgi:hypothetical protein